MRTRIPIWVLLNLITSVWLLGQNHVLHLDGDGDYVSLPSTIIEGTEFTIEGWAYTNGTGGGLDGQHTIFTQRDYSTGTGAASIILNAESPTVGDMIRFNIRSTVGPNDIVEYPASNYEEWHHYAGVVSTDSVYLYFDGELVDIVENTQSGNYNQSVELIEIGRHYHASSYLAGYFNGYIDNLRIWGGALNRSDILDAKNAFIQYIDLPLLAHWDFESEDFIDVTQNGHDGTPMDDAHIIEMNLNNIDLGYSLYLDGIDDYVGIPEPIIYTSEFTIEVWAAMLGVGGGLDQQNTLFTQRDYLTETGSAVIILNAEAPTVGDMIRFNIRSTNGSNDIVEYPASNYAEWHHYTGVVGIDSIYLYLDGVLVSTAVNTQTGDFDYSIDHVEIGRHFHSVLYEAGYFHGYIDELKIWSIPKSAEQIQNDMFEALTGNEPELAAYYNFDNQVADDLSTWGNHGTLLNGADIIVADISPNACLTRGDANGDGITDISDLITLVQYIIGRPVNNLNERCADISGDGIITISDVMVLIDYLLAN
ncbi:MAG: hypothetical protein H8E26_13350 [FCB group bacterium]|nr:hypothetical protein [FCB group bacterium]MBL7028780.1 hypothetical protein [Candidatus Neomarinimicrobiota bacterium]MBL7121336.1 hypothetical protein [Candidatus Neomarinimicrobiota bacterium]